MQTVMTFGRNATWRAALALVLSALSSHSAFAQGRPEIVWARGHSTGGLISPNRNMVLSLPSLVIRDRAFLSRLWDSGFIRTVLWNRFGDGVITSNLVFTHDGSHVAAAGYSGSQGNQVHWIKIWRISDDVVVRTITINGRADQIDLSSRGDLVAALINGLLTIWSVSDGSLIRTLQPSRPRLDALVKFSPDGRLVGVQAGTHDGFRCWRVSDWAELYTIGQSTFTRDFGFSLDGSWLAMAHSASIKIHNAFTGSEILTINLNPPLAGIQLVFIPDNRLMAVVNDSTSRNVFIWRVPDGTLVSQYPLRWHGTVSYLNSMLAYSGGTIWRINDGTLIRRLPSYNPANYVAAVENDPSRILIFLLRSTLGSIANVVDGSSMMNVSWLSPGRVAISPNGTLIAGSSISAEEPVSVSVYNTATGERVYTINTYSGTDRVEYGEITGLSFSRDGSLLAVCGYNQICTNYDYYNNYCYQNRVEHFAFWVNAATGVRVGGISANVPTFLKFAPNGTAAVSDGTNHTIRVWAIPTGNLLRTLSGHTGRVNELVFSPDGTVLASASEDRTIRLWNTSNWSQMRVLNGHTSGVTSLAFSPDGTLLASAGADDTIRIWRVADGALLRTYTEETYQVTSIVWISDLLIYARQDGVVIAARERSGRRDKLPAVAR